MLAGSAVASRLAMLPCGPKCVDRTPTGALQMLVDIRSLDQTILVRLDKNGLRTISGIYMLRPDKSTVILENQYGSELLYARYLNPRAFTLRGVITSDGVDANLEQNAPGMCAIHGGVDIVIF